MLTHFEKLGYAVLLQTDIVSGQHQTILQSCRRGVLGDRFRLAIQRINPSCSVSDIEAVLQKLTRDCSIPLVQHNRLWHLGLLEGIPVKSRVSSLQRAKSLQFIDFSNPYNNDWLVIHGFPVIDGEHQHCLDLVVFINGLPLTIFHGLHIGPEAWSLRAAYLQLTNYQAHLPHFFSFNEFLVLTNGEQARIGTVTNRFNQFIRIEPAYIKYNNTLEKSEIEILLQSIFIKQKFLQTIHKRIVFQRSQTTLNKKIRSYSL